MEPRLSNPFTSPSISNYNTSPPTDDGAATAANQITWAKIKTKLPDPLKAALEATITNTAAAFGKIAGGGDTVSSSVGIELDGTYQGKTVVITAAGQTITTPDASSVGSPFCFGVLNSSSGNLTLDGYGTQTINGSETLTITAGGGGLLITNGNNWFYLGSGQNSVDGFASGTKALFFQTAAPTGWTKDTSLDDATIRLVSGSVGDDGGSANFSDAFSARTILATHLPNHNLTVTDPGHIHGIVRGAPNSGNVAAGGGENVIDSLQGDNTNPAVTGISVAFDDAARGGTQQTFDLDVKYAAAIRATKD
jgi:hypothetical protein